MMALFVRGNNPLDCGEKVVVVCFSYLKKKGEQV